MEDLCRYFSEVHGRSLRPLPRPSAGGAGAAGLLRPASKAFCRKVKIESKTPEAEASLFSPKIASSALVLAQLHCQSPLSIP